MPILEWIAVLKLEDKKLHTYRQPSEDPSEGFKRVLEEEKKGNLISFHLEYPKGQKSLGVNLKSGHFIFSFVFNYHPAPEIIRVEQYPIYRLINFRRKGMDFGTGGYRSDEFLSSYILGWQTTINDNNIQRMMFIDANTLEVTIKEKR